MDTIKIITLSVIQGITELLPISSTGHLILAGNLLDYDISGNTLFLSVLHLGTTLAIILFFRKELFKNFFTRSKWLFFLKLLLASIPVAVVGFLFEGYITELLHKDIVIAISLISIGILFIIIENIKIKAEIVAPENIPLSKMLLIGLGQTLALIPGTSRSGITTLTGMWCGMDKYSAFNFSFILGIPILLGSTIYEIVKAYLNISDRSILTGSLSIVKMIPTILVTFLIGYLALHIVKKFQKKKWLTVFGIYRILIGILILILAI